MAAILDQQNDPVDIRTKCMALWDWTADSNDTEQITFKAGDVLALIRREGGGWWYGELLRTHEIGYFPENYVKVLTRNWKVDANRVSPMIVSLQQNLHVQN